MKEIKRTVLLLICLLFMFTGIVHANKQSPGTTIILRAGKSTRLTIGYKAKHVKWRTSKNKVASVNSKGKVRAKSKGISRISAKVGKRIYSWKVKVIQPVKKITVNKKKVALKGNGASCQIKAIAYPKNANNRFLTWKSSNDDIAIVNESGKVTAVNNGFCTITVTANDGSGKKASVGVTVTGIEMNEERTIHEETEKSAAYEADSASVKRDTEQDTAIFNLSRFQECLIIDDSKMHSLFLLNNMPVNPEEITITLSGEEMLKINNFIQREKEINRYGYISGEAYYVGGWEKRIAYVEAGYNPSGYAPIRIDIYPFLSQGTFTVEIYYQGELVAKSKIYMNAVEPKWCCLENTVQTCERQTWNASMNEKEKIDSLAEYIRNNKRYSEVDCKTGAQILFCAAMDLGIDTCLGFENSSVLSYDYRSVAYPLGHTWCMIKYEDVNDRYDVQGYL